jgi:2'-5' RNA ligase
LSDDAYSVKILTTHGRTVKKRLFIAVDLTQEARQSVAAYIRSMRDEFKAARAGWIKAENLHLTLKFLGETEESRIADIEIALANALAEVRVSPVRLSGTGAFPSAARAKVLWIGCEDPGRLLETAAGQLDADLEPVGFPAERGRFSPHLTIARIRSATSDTRRLASAHTRNRFEGVEFDVREVVLYQSELSPGGSVYTPVLSKQLKS